MLYIVHNTSHREEQQYIKKIANKAKQYESKDEWFKIELCFKKCISSIYCEEIESQNKKINLIENERLQIMNNKYMELHLEEAKH